uniref:Uncharacterized protein n=1 Tax=Peronospora matthiolae TaxID=2874970 RepID=A0AAV1VFP2_9STRA
MNLNRETAGNLLKRLSDARRRLCVLVSMDVEEDVDVLEEVAMYADAS